MPDGAKVLSSSSGSHISGSGDFFDEYVNTHTPSGVTSLFQIAQGTSHLDRRLEASLFSSTSKVVGQGVSLVE